MRSIATRRRRAVERMEDKVFDVLRTAESYVNSGKSHGWAKDLLKVAREYAAAVRRVR